ncbi:hypothetical protein KPZU09_28590 [Klebsiella pneumoniae]|uniref:Uncharacterized protein n=1 Tax=Klebsiella pneumoniae TaxID=573 RepID=A0A919HTE4_KLEPN|nr:hypothetical protein KPZU09_28590 [Klebsiella pneumoniae]
MEVLLADRKTRLNVAITAQSAEKLGLDEGEVLVLLKAPWVGITLDPQQPARPITSCRDVSVISNAGPDSAKY